MNIEDMFSSISANEYTIDDMIKMWPQASGELCGFANALKNSKSGLTAAQLRMAIQMADAVHILLEKHYKK